jgi:hypothetical protein
MTSTFFRATFRSSALRSALVPKHSFRYFSTPPPEVKKSSGTLYLGLGAVVAAGGLAAFYFSNDSAVKTKVFAPTQQDYQKVSC